MVLEWDVLFQLSHRPARSITELAEIFDCDKLEMSGIVSRLISEKSAFWESGELKNSAKCEHDTAIRKPPKLRLIICR